MGVLTVLMPYSAGSFFFKTLDNLAKSDLVDSIIVISGEAVELAVPRCRVILADPIVSGKTLSRVLDKLETEYLLVLSSKRPILLENGALEGFVATAGSTKAGMVYGTFYDETRHGKILHPLNDYQLGSFRDNFDFGNMMLFSTETIRKATQKCGEIASMDHAGLYDLRLKVSIVHPIHHVQRPLYSVITSDEPAGGDKLFAYVDPRNVDVQREMESVFTDYLRKIGAYLPPDGLRAVERSNNSFPVEASVIIPVRNRRGTVADAVKSALSQETDFPFNVIVVDNHSTDGTTTVLSGLAGQCPALHHIVPERTDLGIGGCWNEAVNSKVCGRYAVQLDSDDLYGSKRALKSIVDRLRQGEYAMVIGSYTVVNSALEVIPPGLVDHREWTDTNGHNNALRINGLGAPRAFDMRIIRRIGFLNVSYGEDYAAGLRICREYKIGRIYESLYLCRRWEGNTDAALTVEEANRNDAFKDRIRTEEILARENMNKECKRAMVQRE